ncbi:MAG: hypothetical protein CVV42_02070 [Candidatus Riflebacteria bacterium HGW-Riflebacteria-2]|nr:MAG: hypothetical protein CVV42_02070 [Candidatus Riflebacteria bacterium HGW-Riflebacteria-2]
MFAAIKSVFIASSTSKSQETVRTGLIFGFIIALLSLLLLMTGLYNGIDSYINTMVLQVGFQTPEKQNESVWIVKKDQATSELLEKNPDREEFASVFRFLGQPQIVKRMEGYSGSGLRLFQIDVGCFKDYKNMLFKTGYAEWGTFVDASDQASATRVDAFDLKKWRSGSNLVRKYINEKPEERAYTSLIKVTSQLWTPTAKYAFSILAGGGQHLIMPTLTTDWSNPELRRFLQSQIDKNAESSGTGAEKVPEDLEPAIKLLKRWQNLFLNLRRVDPRLIISFCDSPGVLFSVSFDFFLEPAPPEFLVEPSSVIGFDFVFQGEKRPATDEALIAAIASSSGKVILAAHTMMEEDLRGHAEDDIEGDNANRLRKKGTAKFVQRLIVPHEKFIRGNAETAMIDMGIGSKGFVDKAPMFIVTEQAKKLMPSFSLKIAMLELDRRHPDMKPSYTEEMTRVLAEIYDSVASGTFRGPLVIHDRQIPVDSRGFMFIDYVGSTIVGSTVDASRNKAAISSVSLYECFDRKTLAHLHRQMPHKKALLPENAHRRTLGV